MRLAAACTAAVATTRAALSTPDRSLATRKGRARTGAAPRPGPGARAGRGTTRHAILRPARTVSWHGCAAAVATTVSYGSATPATTSSTRGSPTRPTFSGNPVSGRIRRQEGVFRAPAATVVIGTPP